MLCCSGLGISSASAPYGYVGTGTRMGYMDLPGTDLSDNQLSVCPGYQYTFELFCWPGRSLSRRNPDKGFKLFGGIVKGKAGGL